MDQAVSPSKPGSVAAPTEQYSLGQSILLHLLPGAFATGVYILTVPFFTGRGYPSIIALYLPMSLTVVTLELGYLFYQGQKKSGTFSLKGVVNNLEPVPWWMYIAFQLLILVWGVLVTGLVSPIDNLLLNKGFAWLPDWYALRNLLEIKTAYPREAIVVTAICALTLNGLAGPIVEEPYFRGHLLPRLSR